MILARPDWRWPGSQHPGASASRESTAAFWRAIASDGRIVDFERGGTQVVPGLAEKWTVSKDGLEYSC